MRRPSELKIVAGTKHRKSELCANPDWLGVRRGNSFVTVWADPFEYDDAAVRIGLQYDETYNEGYQGGLGEGEKRVTRKGEVEMTANVLLRATVQTLEDTDFKISQESATRIIGAVHNAMKRASQLDEEDPE